MIPTRRRISRSSVAYRNELRDLLQSAFVAELIGPSDHLWLVSPWVSDIPVIDNSAGSFRPLIAEWGARQLRLAEVLASLVRQQTLVTLATRPLPDTDLFVEQVQNELRVRGGTTSRFRVHQSETLHEKGLLGEGFHISGSMNFTMNGIELLEEAILFETDRAAIAEARLDFEKRWPEAP